MQLNHADNRESTVFNKKVKVSPLQAMKSHRGCGCKGPHIHSHSTRVASHMIGHLYTRGKPTVLIFRRLSGPQDQSGQEGVKKNLHHSDTQDQTWAVQPVGKHLVA